MPRVRAELDASRPPRLDSLTGARFVAAAAVFLYHASLAYPSDGVFGQALAVFARDGAMGVDPFFALSGFVLTWTWRPGTSARSFYRRRFARLAPAYWVALVFGLVWVILLYGEPWVMIGASVPAVFAIQAWFPDPAVHFAADGPEWSVSAEVFFYALFPVLVAAAASRRGRGALLVVAVVLGVITPSVLPMVTSGATGSWLLNILPAFKVGAFVCGIVLATMLKQGFRIPVGPRVAGALLLVLFLIVPLSPSWVPQHAILLCAVLLVIAALAQADQLGRPSLLASPIAVRLGEWSYCFYLVHLMTLQIALIACARILPAGALGPVWLAVAFVASLAIAALLHAVIERPFERRLRGSTAPRGTAPGKRAPMTTALRAIGAGAATRDADGETAKLAS